MLCLSDIKNTNCREAEWEFGAEAEQEVEAENRDPICIA
ncbi:hypothetical protein BRUCa_3210 [Brucella melitensis]|nr:conserved hypothetical protein [Brucella melitensis M28]ADZ89163.1 conserved hypothetical protein [Brucella melitensis M5-90]AEW16091.1 hypothetical protein BCA52141_II1465 [Brucella canis HSK A52141]AEW19709.1 hypothetical protein BAA13334_II01820 [Brucella abortus A13334]AIB19722.1 Hypothetical protein BSSP3_II1037 [Brucella suis bv. 2]